MAKIVVITDCKNSRTHEVMAANALKKIAENLGHKVKIETTSYLNEQFKVTDEDIRESDIVIIAVDSQIDTKRLKGKFIYPTSISNAIVDTQTIVEAAIKLAKIETKREQVPTFNTERINIVAVTACPTGIAHAFMAAESLKKAASLMGYNIKIETQGMVGTRNILTEEEIKASDLVIVVADTKVNMSRFKNKPVYYVSTNKAINDAEKVIADSFDRSKPYEEDFNKVIQEIKKENIKKQTGFSKHLFNGVSFIIPLVVSGGLIIVLSLLFGPDTYEQEGTLAHILNSIGEDAAFKLIIPVLSGYIAFSIADRSGLASGLIGGLIAYNIGLGFLGGIISGFIAGYSALFLKNKVNVPKNVEGIKTTLIIPLLSSLVTGLFMFYVIGKPTILITNEIKWWLSTMSQTNSILLGFIIGSMMAADLGGPINKSVYTFAVGLLASKFYMPMAAAMAAGMTPPLGLSLAALLSKKRFSSEEREFAGAAGILGLCFLTEGAIPFAANDPFRVIPCIIAGSAVTGAISAYFGCGILTPYPGIFTMIMPNAIIGLSYYIIAILSGTIITAILVILAKKPFY